VTEIRSLARCGRSLSRRFCTASCPSSGTIIWVSQCLRLSAQLRPHRACYTGYYIHTCAKMRYKGEYGPSYLLDPVRTREWQP
jgi:arginyl-tRNA--protein-N-Asp/Glu arginylyltransferase